MNELSLKWMHRPGEAKVGGPGSWKTERWTLDFVVDGRSLFEALDAKRFDFVGVLEAELYQPALDGLVAGPAPIADRRHPVYVCSECADLSCGALTVEIEHGDDKVAWRGFRYENDYDPTMTDSARYSDVGPFEFSAKQYREMLTTGRPPKP